MADDLARSTREVAEALDVPLRTLQDWLKRGVIPHRRMGRRYVIDWAVVKRIRRDGLSLPAAA